MIEVRIPKLDHEWRDYYDLRYRILREPLSQPRGSEKNEGDKTGVHLALFDANNLLAIARLDKFDKGISQVRFVAVENNCQGKGYGKLIMQAVEEKSKELGNTKMILHARENAVDFYLSLNYEMIEKSHLLLKQVQHYLMEKEY